MFEKDDIHQVKVIFNLCCLVLILSMKIFPKTVQMLFLKGRNIKSKAPKRKKSVSETEFSDICLDFESVKKIKN
jgi:hypothetical protein